MNGTEIKPLILLKRRNLGRSPSLLILYIETSLEHLPVLDYLFHVSKDVAVGSRDCLCPRDRM